MRTLEEIQDELISSMQETSIIMQEVIKQKEEEIVVRDKKILTLMSEIETLKQ